MAQKKPKLKKHQPIDFIFNMYGFTVIWIAKRRRWEVGSMPDLRDFSMSGLSEYTRDCYNMYIELIKLNGKKGF